MPVNLPGRLKVTSALQSNHRSFAVIFRDILIRAKARAELGAKVEFLLWAKIYCSIHILLSSILISSGFSAQQRISLHIKTFV